jgi:hypothetical protein
MSKDSDAADYVTLAAKSVLGFVPFVGSALAEFAGSFIPNQRMDRVAKFAIELSRRLSEAEQRLLKDSLQNPDFGDLMEESMRQAASSLSDERRPAAPSTSSGPLPGVHPRGSQGLSDPREAIVRAAAQRTSRSIQRCSAMPHFAARRWLREKLPSFRGPSSVSHLAACASTATQQ